MELIRENLLIFVSLFSVAAYAILWGLTSELPMLSCFCFFRRELEKRQWILMGKLVLPITVVSIFIYYGIGYLAEIRYVNPLMLLMIPLSQCVWHLMVSCMVSCMARGSVIWALILTGGAFAVPWLLIAYTWGWKLCLDDFAGWILVGLFVINILLFRRSKTVWREEDLI